MKKNLREDIHALVAAQLDRTDARKVEPELCDYLADLARLFINLMEEEAVHTAEANGLDRDGIITDWQERVG